MQTIGPCQCYYIFVVAYSSFTVGEVEFKLHAVSTTHHLNLANHTCLKF